jgi:hypothetical protein
VYLQSSCFYTTGYCERVLCARALYIDLPFIWLGILQLLDLSFVGVFTNPIATPAGTRTRMRTLYGGLFSLPMFCQKNFSGPTATYVPSLMKFRNQRNTKSKSKEDMDLCFVVLRVIQYTRCENFPHHLSFLLCLFVHGDSTFSDLSLVNLRYSFLDYIILQNRLEQR